jgi:hypothetical protein
MNSFGATETLYRLRLWNGAQVASEGLAAQVLLSQGFIELDPSHPMGGRDGGKDAICFKDGMRWVMAVHFSSEQQTFSAIKKKFQEDLTGARKNSAFGMAFVTNQKITDGQRKKLENMDENISITIYHLNRIVSILDDPKMYAVRNQFLGIKFSKDIETHDEDGCICSRCGTFIKNGYFICLGCKAQMYYGSNPEQRANDVQISSLFGVLIFSIVFYFFHIPILKIVPIKNLYGILYSLIIYIIISMATSLVMSGLWVKYCDAKRKKTGPHFC